MTDKTQSANPLLQLDGLPKFRSIRPEHVLPALSSQLDANREHLLELETVAENARWDNFVQPMEDLEESLARMWSPVSHLNSVQDSPELRKAYEAALPLLTAYYTEVAQNETFFRGYQEVAARDDFKDLSPAQQRIVHNALRDLRLAGVDLPEKDKQRFKVIRQQLSQLGNRFDRNVLDATQGWWLQTIDNGDLAGLPKSLVDLAGQQAESAKQPGWRFTLDIPSYLPFMMYSQRRDLRQKMYQAYVTRASEQGPQAGKFDNGEIMLETLALRREMAHLLGYENFARVSLVPKMAESPQQVIEFLRDLAHRSRSAAQDELQAVRELARSEDQLQDLEPWDLAYYSERLRQSLYAFNDEQVRPYFPAGRVLQGMFQVVQRLYGLRIKEVSGIEVWDPSVHFYEIKDDRDVIRGRFYVDLYARPNKRGGAWMDELQSRKQRKHDVQVPVAYLVCNFAPPVGGKPALLTHNEVITLFHEFGHGLHHMLTNIDHIGVAGINGVAWDAVELPSQFMENWCWEREALDLLGGHYETGEPLPSELLRKMKAAKNFQSAMQMLRQIEFALFDMRLHAEFDSGQQGQLRQILTEVRDEVAVVFPPEYNRFENSFSHIFAGGYAAGYYSYKWAEVLSADAFARFEEEGIFNPATGRDFLHKILEPGGSRDAMELFVEFRGREPTVDALLRHSGLAA